MNIDQYTNRAKAVVQAAQSLALEGSHQQVAQVHILTALLDEDAGLVDNLVQRSGADLSVLKTGAANLFAKVPVVGGSGVGNLTLSREAGKVFATAETTAKKSGDKYITVEGLFLALILSADKDIKALFANSMRL